MSLWKQITNFLEEPLDPIYLMCKDDGYVDRLPDRRVLGDEGHNFKCGVCGKKWSFNDALKPNPHLIVMP